MATHRILLMAVLFDSFGEEPTGDPLVDASSAAWVKSPATATVSMAGFTARADAYVADVVQSINQGLATAGDPSLWWIADVWNEPAVGTAPHSRLAELLETVRALPSPPATTVGFADFEDNEKLLASLTDPEALTILSGHPYGIFEEVITSKVQRAVEIGNAYGGKPVFVSEAGLPGLFQYYGNVLSWLEEAQVGFTLWEAYVGNNQFRNLTGIFYAEPPLEGFVTVRSTRDANALWAVAQRRDPGFRPTYIARQKGLNEDPVILGPAKYELHTGAYHELLMDSLTYYGTPDFPFLDTTRPSTLALYEKLMTWAFLSFGRVLMLDPQTGLLIVETLDRLVALFDLGDQPGAESALLELFTATSELMETYALGEPANHPPEVLELRTDVRLTGGGTTFDVRLKAIAFDIDDELLDVHLYAIDALTGFLIELPLEPIPETGAHGIQVTGVARTFGAQYLLAVVATDPHGETDLYLEPVTLP